MNNKTKDPGLGSAYEKDVKRLLNEDGSYNIKRNGGVPWYKDSYKFFIDISWWKFLLLCFGIYLVLNLLFASTYFILGVQNIEGIDFSKNTFLQTFYFSAQTFTTVGYGGLLPKSDAVHLLATIEAFVGFLSFSLATGILYGRFSKPKSRIVFSKNIILTDFQDGKAVMFKLVNKRKNVLLKAELDVILSIDKNSDINDHSKDFFKLNLEMNSINFFPLTWTVVHKIDSDSPLYNLTFNEINTRNIEVIILVKAFDETFSQEVFQKYSYAHNQWKENVKFDKNFAVNEDGVIELHVDKLNELKDL